ncbi:MAG: hypothetical protein U1D30_06675 [Planctomycetota bacterium]
MEPWQGKNKFTDRTGKAFFVPKQEIADNNYDLPSTATRKSSTRKSNTSPQGHHRPPQKLEAEIAKDLADLEAMLG